MQACVTFRPDSLKPSACLSYTILVGVGGVWGEQPGPTARNQQLGPHRQEGLRGFSSAPGGIAIKSSNQDPRNILAEKPQWPGEGRRSHNKGQTVANLCQGTLRVPGRPAKKGLLKHALIECCGGRRGPFEARCMRGILACGGLTESRKAMSCTRPLA